MMGGYAITVNPMTNEVTWNGLAAQFTINYSALDVATSDFTLMNFTGAEDDILMFFLTEGAGNLKVDDRCRDKGKMIAINNPIDLPNGPAFYYGVVSSTTESEEVGYSDVTCSDLKYFLDFNVVKENYSLRNKTPFDYRLSQFNKWSKGLPLRLVKLQNGEYKGPAYKIKDVEKAETVSFIDELVDDFSYYQIVCVPVGDSLRVTSDRESSNLPYKVLNLGLISGDDFGTQIIDESIDIRSPNVYVRPVMNGKPNGLNIAYVNLKDDGSFKSITIHQRFITKNGTITDDANNSNIVKPIKMASFIYTPNTNHYVEPEDPEPDVDNETRTTSTTEVNEFGETVTTSVSYSNKIEVKQNGTKTTSSSTTTNVTCKNKSGATVYTEKIEETSSSSKDVDGLNTSNSNSTTTTRTNSLERVSDTGDDDYVTYSYEADTSHYKKVQSESERYSSDGTNSTTTTTKINTEEGNEKKKTTKDKHITVTYPAYSIKDNNETEVKVVQSKETVSGVVWYVTKTTTTENGTYKAKNEKTETKTSKTSTDTFKTNDEELDDTVKDDFDPDKIADEQLEVPEYSHEISFFISKDSKRVNDICRIGNKGYLKHKGKSYNSIVNGYQISSKSDYVKVTCGNIATSLASLLEDEKKTSSGQTNIYNTSTGGTGGNYVVVNENDILEIIDKYLKR